MCTIIEQQFQLSDGRVGKVQKDGYFYTSHEYLIIHYLAIQHSLYEGEEEYFD